MTQEAVQLTETPPLPGLQLVQDINKALQTLGTDFAGPDDPADKAWPYATWADTANGVLRRRSADNTVWWIERTLFEDVRLTGSAIDTTPGRALKTGDWGIGGTLPVVNGADLLADDYMTRFYVTTGVNTPAGSPSSAGYVEKENRGSDYRKVTFIPGNGRGPWINICNNGVWTGWVELYHTANLPAASETVAGLAKFTTQALANAFVDDATVVTPAKMGNAPIFGPKQSEQIVSRTPGTTYTNATGKPIWCCVYATVGSSGAYCGLYGVVGGSSLPRSIMYGVSIGGYMAAQATIMPGASYIYMVSGASGYTMWEIR